MRQRNPKSKFQNPKCIPGERVEVDGILVLPGWWIERVGRGPVNVLNEKEVRNSFRTERRLADAQIARIVHQLTGKCRLECKKPTTPPRRSRGRARATRQLKGIAQLGL